MIPYDQYIVIDCLNVNSTEMLIFGDMLKNMFEVRNFYSGHLNTKNIPVGGPKLIHSNPACYTMHKLWADLV